MVVAFGLGAGGGGMGGALIIVVGVALLGANLASSSFSASVQYLESRPILRPSFSQS